jgi:hypothetical protein
VKEAEDRAWEVVRRAYLERTPKTPRRSAPRPVILALAVVAVAAVAAAGVTAPGRALVQRVREVVGVEHASQALFSLPASGRLLVVSTERGGVWLVDANGYKRKLGPYDDAEWSPHGLFIVATRDNELVALDADGDVRWTLARHDPAWPRWEGTRTDTRIAYVSRGALRVVAGDGTGDHVLDRFGGGIAPAWDPGRLHTIAYYAGGAIVLRRDDGKLVWRRPAGVLPTALAWSSDGRLLAVFSPKRVVVLDASGRIVRTISMLSSESLRGAFAPATHDLAVAVALPGRTEIRLVDVDHPGTAKLLFAGPGRFGDLAWSPNGEWLLVTWPAANQWVFLRGSRAHAVGNIGEQFPRHDRLGPHLELADRWCCAQ